ncbi:MAG: DUF4362 domain-containing protein [Lachnospiraceae bacterium]|nr:DUF4362 domain-containing protein [Lachnospiraceae bacterium]
MKIRKRVTNGFMVVLMLSSVLVLQGCNSGDTKNVESSMTQANVKENAETASPVEKEQNEESLLDFSDNALSPTEPQTNYTDIKKLPADYSEDMAIRDGVVVKKLDGTLNKEMLYRFCDSYLEGKDAMVRVMFYTTEGDPIIQDISYKEDRITLITDSSRDKFGSGDAIDETQFRYIVEHKGLLYLSKNDTWEDENDFFFAGIGDKEVWKGHLAGFRN